MWRTGRCVLIAVALATPASAQDAASRPTFALDGRLVFYGDNAELDNEFRTGETALGAFGTIVVEATINDRLAVRAGAFGHQRFGSLASFDEARPVLALVIRGPRSRIVLGTLETMRRTGRAGPDQTTPHGLLPPLQREGLAFDRPFEGGLQWIAETARVTHDSWIHWQRRGDRTQRERFDVGIVNAVRIRPELTVHTQVHHVHQGGPLAGGPEPVADSFGAAFGVEAGGAVGRLDRLSLALFAVGSRHVPDRGRPELTRGGFGTFVRVSLERTPWRAHAILWRSDDFIKTEGEPLYHALRRDGTRVTGLRDYGEAGITRTCPLAPESNLEASFRFHRVERAFDYSFRVLAVARVRVPLTR